MPIKHDPQAIAALALLINEEATGVGFGRVIIALRSAELIKLGNTLSNLAVADCNYGLSPRQETRRENIIKRISAIGKELGVTFETNGDPRGYVLKLMTPKTGAYNSMGGASEGWGIA